jgi:hypothetical protein
MTFIVGGALIGGATVLGAGINAYTANKAAKEQVKAQRESLARQEELQAPFREAGLTSQNRLLDYMGLGKDPKAEGFGRYARDFSMSDYQEDPGYQFRLKEGLKALDRKAAMRGGSLGGNALRAGQEYAQDMASQEYQNAFNRYQINRSNQLQPLQSLMGAGQTSSNILTGATDKAYGAMGDARASGYLGVGNAINQGISGLTNYYQGQNQLSAYNARTKAMGGG